MASLNHATAILQLDKNCFTTSDIKVLLQIEKNRTLEDAVQRLIKSKVLISLERGKYLKGAANVSDFEIAQFLYSPSYISFETALNYHGILSQFPMEITSATTKRRIIKKVLGKVFSYANISTKLFTGYYKEDKFLMALPEKALFDQLYMIARGLKTEQYMDEMDYTRVKKQELNKYLPLVPDSFAFGIKDLISQYI